MLVRVLLLALVAFSSDALRAAPAPFAKPARPKAEPPFEVVKQEMAEKTGFHVQDVTQEGPLWLVKCNSSGGYHVATFTVRNASTREAALRKLINLYGRSGGPPDKPKK
jgi:hypothetical protein